ncbi:MAG: methyltransferase domain-containing protein [Desulfobacteraceae bacterium]|nr:methyltransferase domain-containing protein [Desulfobacteraceae bacterium]
MNALIRRLYHHPFLAAFMHTLVHELQKELQGCKSVIDLGCGPSSPLQYCPWIKHSIGVEAFEPYLKKSMAKKIHTEYLNAHLEALDFPDKSVDAVIMIDVLEHLPEALGYQILKKAERWARKKIIVSSPNGFIEQSALDDNELQRHLSGWNYARMKSLGFRCRGMAGPKWLRREVEGGTMGDDLLASIRFRPRVFWFVISSLLQPVCFFAPKFAFSLFSVKTI